MCTVYYTGIILFLHGVERRYTFPTSLGFCEKISSVP